VAEIVHNPFVVRATSLVCGQYCVYGEALISQVIENYNLISLWLAMFRLRTTIGAETVSLQDVAPLNLLAQDPDLLLLF
jgi:hypothetical protein